MTSECPVTIVSGGWEAQAGLRERHPPAPACSVRRARARARAIAGELLDAIVPKGRCEVVGEFARPLASRMFLGLVDWPLDQREQLEHWVELE